MRWIAANTKWIMLLAGALTCTMLYAALSPRAALLSTFGEALDGPVANVVVRNWGALIALVGGMLVYGAFHKPSRPVALAVAVLSKLTFIGLVLSHGRRFLDDQAGISIAVDGVMVILLTLCLLAARPERARSF
jgi:hypothetical protein